RPSVWRLSSAFSGRRVTPTSTASPPSSIDGAATTMNWLHWIPFLPLIGAAINLTIGAKLPRWLSAFVACASGGFAAILAMYAVGTLYIDWREHYANHQEITTFTDSLYKWIESGAAMTGGRIVERLTIDLAFKLDNLSAVMIFTVTFVGFLIHVY